MSTRLALLFILLTVLIPASAGEISGRIISSTNKKGIGFASIYIIEESKGTVADIDGNYKLSTHLNGDFHVRVSSVGYVTRELPVGKGVSTLDITLDEQSVALKDFTITAKYRGKVGSDATIGQEAMEYIQPTSVRDLFTLLPGGTVGSTDMQSGQLMSVRQVGSDMSTAFGMGVSINGIPLQNDGMRMQMTGITGSSRSADNDNNVSVNSGIDLRTLSTDHLQAATVTRGISSAKEGNISSGSIRLETKRGESPLRVRLKFDPQNKLAYVGKGLNLGEQAGTLYLGADIVHSARNIEDTRGAFNRATGTLNWNNQKTWWGKKVDMNVEADYITTFSNNKSDQLIKAYHEKYNTRYQRVSLMGKLNFAINEPWMDNLELMASADYTSDKLKYNKHVTNVTVTPLQSSTEEGEHEGTYLPTNYDTYYEMDNQPLNFFGQIDGEKYGTIGHHINYSVLLGASLTSTKNIGDGAVVDPNRPPYPSSDFIRPRRNKDIPAIANQASYVETKWRYNNKWSELNLSLGLREVMMLNLPSDYYLHGMAMLEPRIQGGYTLRSKIGDKTMSNTIRLGFGVEDKLPSADYLYPDKIYHDLLVLNAYFNDPAKRLLITDTRIFDPTNKQLHANKNRKWELGYDFAFNGYELSLTAFHEQMNGGVEYFTSYVPVSYNYYTDLLHPVDTKPTKDDFAHTIRRSFINNTQPYNSSKVVKKGLEYRIATPELPCVKTSLEINGAYYKTMYTSGVPVMERPVTMVNGENIPYVGIYDGYDKEFAETFNTNFWFNTHLPKWKLIFTNFIQIIWMQKDKLATDVDVYPEHYMDLDGNIHNYDLTSMTSDPILGTLKRDFLAAKYNENSEPVSLLWNIKATKEFSRHAKLSFFADNIIQINPKYQDKYRHSIRNQRKPFFGLELTLNL